ncbi:lipopolysaccharide assembly protein LapA domain-containing protein [Deinococcus koreensis]|uniref:lipopolysaccharide assembly protein LapA domain-containing protein n=1 Tax=Deinococcus koreensis TaxID=2054903 RepID=UPI000DD9C719|nr:lipopolysaccharide assembly protein LapA domain-containing protein [Deinococcus koreensis]
MRFVSFLQVLLLLSIAAYLLLVTLENPLPVRLPLPLGGGELSLSVGLTVTLFLVLGALYATLLLLPPVWRAQARRRREGQERARVEERLTATLQARLGSMAAPVPGAGMSGGLSSASPSHPSVSHHSAEGAPGSELHLQTPTAAPERDVI